MSSMTCTETVAHHKAEADETTLLPSLRDAMPPSAVPASRNARVLRRATSDKCFDDFCQRDNLLYLRLGQGTGGARDERRPGSSLHDDTRSVAETELDECEKQSPKSSTHMFPTFSPPPMDDFFHADREEQLGSVQRDVYDVAPPPGYKRLKRVPGRSFDIDIAAEHMSVTAAMDQLLSASYSGGQPRKHRRCSPNKMPPLGDGFSGDETQPRKRAKADRMAVGAKRSKRSARSRGSRGSRGSKSNQDNDGSHDDTIFVKRKKGKGDPAPPLLGSLDVVSLSQEDIEAAKAAAMAAARAAAKSKDIAKFVIPLRPMSECPDQRQRTSWSLDLGEGPDDETGDVVFDVDGSADADVETTLSALPSLRQH